METINLIANQDQRGGIITVKGPRELHFRTVEELTEALKRSAIDPFKYKDQLEHLAGGIPVGLFVTAGQLSAFYS
jgi:hypothetical protein